MYKEINLKDYQNRDIVIPPTGIVEAEGEFLPLCFMCKKSRFTCENIYIREVELPFNEGDNPEDEAVGHVRQQDGSYKTQKLGFKVVDGVETGLITSEEDIPIPFVCEWFEPKELG